MKINNGERFNDFTIDFDDEDSEQLRRIVSIELKPWLQLFSEKNREYGGDSDRTLGPRGEFVEINRKVGKLHTAIWEGRPEQLTSEYPSEVLWDIIGHCFMTLDMMRRGVK